jgi:Isoleucyl-tRNA synthetase
MIPVFDEKQKSEVEAMSALILNEVNVKDIKFVSNEDGILVKKVKPDFKKLGPKHGKIMKLLAKSVAEMLQKDILEFEKNGEFTFKIEGNDATIELCDVEIISEDIPGWLVANYGNLTVALDITVTDELLREGIAREIVNRIQNIRKSKDFDITDKIRVKIASDEHSDAAIEEYKDYISKQVLAESIIIEDVKDCDEKIELDMDDYKLYVTVDKA